MALLEVKLRPVGPWRIGHASGERERVGAIYHSDALFSALTHAMRSLGWMEEWLEATVRSERGPLVLCSSLFPFAGNTRLVPPPKTSWPPAAPSRLYLRGAKLVPLEVALGNFDENRYWIDGESGCMVPGGASPPFRVSVRSSVAVDRLSGSASEAHKTACLEFHPRAGLWGLIDVPNLQWETRMRAAFRFLADSGFGGKRSRGWGRAAEPEFQGVTRLFPPVEKQGAWWLLSMYAPHRADLVDWSKGEYATETRGGWTDSPAGVARKKSLRMIEEGSVLAAPELRGTAMDVAPEGFAHPVHRCGFAFAVPIALAGLQVVEQVVEPVVEQVVEPALEPTLEPTVEPPVELEAEPPSEQVTELASAAAEIAEDVSLPVVEEAAGEPQPEAMADVTVGEPPSPEAAEDVALSVVEEAAGETAGDMAAQVPIEAEPEPEEPAEAPQPGSEYPDPDQKPHADEKEPGR